jgi:hypothetical protein
MNDVVAVLIGNTWINIDKASLDIDSFEFLSEGHTVHGGGNSGVCASGFSFRIDGDEICGPLTAIQAVRLKSKSKSKSSKSSK